MEDRTRELDRPPLERRRVATVVVVKGPNSGTRHRLTDAPVMLGTAPTCGIRLTDPAVSKIHCELRTDPHGGVVLIDGGSLNGTWFAGNAQVRKAVLHVGAMFRVGETELVVEGAATEPVLPTAKLDSFGHLIGASAVMQKLYTQMAQVAPRDITVLIGGETGTGKELVARSIHDSSPRRDQPFIAVNCAALAEGIVESELFGHVRGAFSGAVAERAGLFEEADGGTLFLDEIGDLPLTLQPKLLRALESRQVKRVGSHVEQRIDVRVLAATHRSLADRVNRGLFREDLYFRLAVAEVWVPPLRDRIGDVAILARHFLTRLGAPLETLPHEALTNMGERVWPGNVRELRNHVERSVALGWAMAAASRAEGENLPASPAALSALVPSHLPLKAARAVWSERMETLYLEALLRRAGGNVSRAARMAEVNRRSLQRRIQELGLRDRTPDDLDAGALEPGEPADEP
jgi:transcriptional regulator with GAF, ATPase, and Fis domain